MKDIKLIVGLGNMGNNYKSTRHNAGFWVVEKLVEYNKTQLNQVDKYKSLIGNVMIQGQPIKIMLPTTFMNQSGDAVASYTRFFNIAAENILVVHDEVGLKKFEVKLKQGGGNNGHNGLKDIDAKIGKNYWRLRFGIGHPGNKEEMIGYVLGKPRSEEFNLYQDLATDLAKLLTEGNWMKLTQQLGELNSKYKIMM